ncbi:tripartite motif-containing protein 2/3 [Mytilus galloprovincialis]|uniref:Tripartite motif-containing protein 2/3 n=1 Tax=Mytilus galloprovincialis TaxID=29158 RepID=A0A8B6EDS5_MYTGA|nr:tripartite motif-containing protein 2/3 [Mytilus galloprovincialis]
MAFSQAVGIAQTSTVCQFCEESPEIKWKCVNCELFLCNLCCSKIHSKSKASMEHEIINLKDFGTENFIMSVRKVDLDNMECTTHTKRKCIVYCKDCNSPACSKCLTETHKMHEYNAIDEVYSDIISRIRELIHTFESDNQSLNIETDKLQKLLADGDKNFQETREIILQTEKEMKDAISKYTNNLLQELEAKWKPLENVIITELSSLRMNADLLETRMKNLNQVLQSRQVVDIFSAGQTLYESLPNYSIKKIKPYQAKFIPSNLHVKIRSQVLGDLYTVPNFEVIDTYQSSYKSVTNILFSSDKTALIGSFNCEILQNVQFVNHCMKIKKEVNMKVYDMAKTMDGRILVSAEVFDLKIYSIDKKLVKFVSFAPLKTIGVHVTKDNKIIVGLIKNLMIPAPTDCIRKLVVMNSDGDIQHSIEHDRDHQRLLTYPHRINTINDKIVVVDIINKEFEGRVVMLDHGGQLHWIYNGCKTINSDQVKFHPGDVAVTSPDMILVSDCENHIIHALNSVGEVIFYKEVKSLGIELPLSLSIDHNDILWIGCNTCTENKSSASKIICVKLI